MQIEKGGSITFRLPKNTPKEVIDYLNDLKTNKEKSFSSTIAALFIDSLQKEMKADVQQSLSIPLPASLTEDQLKWFKSTQTQEFIASLLAQVFYQNSLEVVVPEKQLPVDAEAAGNELKQSTTDFILENFL